jgi:hypothetical protein
VPEQTSNDHDSPSPARDEQSSSENAARGSVAQRDTLMSLKNQRTIEDLRLRIILLYLQLQTRGFQIATGVFKKLNHLPADPVASMARHYVKFGDGGDRPAKLQIIAER